MPAYWVKFKTRPPGCVEADDQDAAMIAAKLETGKDPVSAERLPYPASPRIVSKKYQDSKGNDYHIPSFCFEPEKCKNKTSCPRRYSCTE